MLIQALFSRGNEPIQMRVHRFDYTFKPNSHGDMVCEVISDEHAKMLVSMGNFKEYKEPFDKPIENVPEQTLFNSKQAAKRAK